MNRIASYELVLVAIVVLVAVVLIAGNLLGNPSVQDFPFAQIILEIIALIVLGFAGRSRRTLVNDRRDRKS